MATAQVKADALVPLTLRLHALEALVKGVPSACDGSETRPEGLGPGRARQRPVTSRVGDVEERLERLGGESDALKRLLTGYEAYKHLLLLGTEESVETEDHVPDSTKISLLVESKGDIMSAERNLRQIELLKGKGVEGSGQLESVLEHRDEVVERLKVASERRDEVTAARAEVAGLLNRYTELSGTVSDLFLDLHKRLEALEDIVRKAERAKRKALSEQY